MNKKGFTLVELLGTMAIIGMLAGLAIGAYSSYIHSTRTKAYQTLVKSSISAMEEYIVDNPSATTATINDLYEKEYLERPTDPVDASKLCDGKVTRTTTNDPSNTTKILPDEKYTVVLCCENYYYTFPNNGNDTPIKNDTCQK